MNSSATTYRNILLTIIVILFAVAIWRVDTRLHEIDQDVDNISDFAQIISQSMQHAK